MQGAPVFPRLRYGNGGLGHVMATRRPERNRARPVRKPARSATSANGPDELTDLGSVPTIVALGSSAGGLDALTSFVSAMPPNSGMAFVIGAHLDPTHASFAIYDRRS